MQQAASVDTHSFVWGHQKALLSQHSSDGFVTHESLSHKKGVAEGHVADAYGQKR